MFATRADLLARSNARRLAQLAVPADYDFPECATESLDGESPEAQEAVSLALAAIDKCLADADALLISYGIPPEIQTTLLARLVSFSNR